MAQEDEAVVDMGDLSLVHVEGQAKSLIEEFAQLLPNAFGLRSRAFDDDDEIVSVSRVRDSRSKPSPFAYRDRRLPLYAGVPPPRLVASAGAHVAPFHMLVELI
jgi:hypothetical protein